MNVHFTTQIDADGKLALPLEWIEEYLNDEGKVALYVNGSGLMIRPIRETDEDYYESDGINVLANKMTKE